VSKMTHTKETNTKETNTKEKYNVDFEKIWSKYPKRDGKKNAFNHYRATVKTEQNKLDIEKALNNYIEHTRETPIQYIKNGSTWFNNWKDWVDWVPNKSRIKPTKIGGMDALQERVAKNIKNGVYTKEEFLGDG